MSGRHSRPLLLPLSYLASLSSLKTIPCLRDHGLFTCVGDAPGPPFGRCEQLLCVLVESMLGILQKFGGMAKLFPQWASPSSQQHTMVPVTSCPHQKLPAVAIMKRVK